jgi:DNA-binding transcriptional LysR family regulator
MQMSLQQLEQVVLLDRLRHFGHAAEASGLSQPAFSRSLKRIEAELGARLFERSRRGVEPTAAGQAVLEFARQSLDQANLLRKQVRDLGQSAGNYLSLACAFYPAALSLPEALAGLSRKMPRLKFELEVVDWFRALEYVQDGTVELALCELSEAENYPTLECEPVARHAVYFVARKGHPLTLREEPRVQDLLSYPWACSRVPARIALALGTAPVAAGAIDHRSGSFMPAVTSPSISTAIRVVSASDLVTPVALSAAADLIDNGTLDIIRISAPWMSLYYGFAWRRGAALSAGARAFKSQVHQIEKRIAERERALALRFGCDRWDARLKEKGPDTIITND